MLKHFQSKAFMKYIYLCEILILFISLRKFFSKDVFLNCLILVAAANFDNRPFNFIKYNFKYLIMDGSPLIFSSSNKFLNLFFLLCNLVN